MASPPPGHSAPSGPAWALVPSGAPRGTAVRELARKRSWESILSYTLLLERGLVHVTTPSAAARPTREKRTFVSQIGSGPFGPQVDQPGGKTDHKCLSTYESRKVLVWPISSHGPTDGSMSNACLGFKIRTTWLRLFQARSDVRALP